MTTNSFDDAFQAAFAAVKAAEEHGERGLEVRGTCQACFRVFTVKPVPKDSRLIDVPSLHRGKMGLVIHGFERPGTGHLHGMCWGAGHPPYELSCKLTIEWMKSLRDGQLPGLRRHLSDLRSGKHKHFTVTVSDRGSYQHGQKAVTRQVILIEGEPLPADYPLETRGPPDFKWLRKRAVTETEQEIASMEKFIAFLDERIKNWRYAPDLLIPKAKLASDLVGKAWFENPKVQALMKSLPAPTGGPTSAQGARKNFLDWALGFPRTMAWTGLRGGSRTPSYYRAVKTEFDKFPQAIAAGLAKTEEQKKQASVAAKDAMSAEKRAKVEAQEKKEAHVKNVLATLLADTSFTAYLKRKSSKNESYSHGISPYGEDRAKDVSAGEDNLYELYLRKISKAEQYGLHGDRMYSLKRIATDLKDIARHIGMKIKLPKSTDN